MAVSKLPGDHLLQAVLVHSNNNTWPTPSPEWAELHHMLHPLLHPPWLKLHLLLLRVVIYKVCTCIAKNFRLTKKFTNENRWRNWQKFLLVKIFRLQCNIFVSLQLYKIRNLWKIMLFTIYFLMQLLKVIIASSWKQCSLREKGKVPSHTHNLPLPLLLVGISNRTTRNFSKNQLRRVSNHQYQLLLYQVHVHVHRTSIWETALMNFDIDKFGIQNSCNIMHALWQ